MKKTKNRFIFLLAGLLLLQSAQAGFSFFQFAQLKMHYKIHHKNSGENFYVFLFQHYGEESAKHVPQDTSHQNLPHKAYLSLGIDHFQPSVYIYTFVTAITFQKPNYFYKENPYHFYRSVPIEPPKAV